MRRILHELGTAAALLVFSSGVYAAGKLEIKDAWIRMAPSGSMMLVGYAQLRNTGDEPVTITSADSRDFRNVSLHESVEENGVAKMRPLGKFSLAPGESVTFAPGGKHFMLMQPAHEMKSGSTAQIHVDSRRRASVVIVNCRNCDSLQCHVRYWAWHRAARVALGGRAPRVDA